jgi:serine phosphatase RsbU (regulator of sigma subunit)
MVRAIMHRREGSSVLLAGYLVLLAAMTNDILFTNGVIHTGNMISFGLLLFIFSQAYLLADRYSNAFRTVETLSIELESVNTELSDLNRDLENKVDARTEELQAAMEEMEAMNQQLIETRDNLWGEMQLAKKIQTVLLPENPAIGGFEIAAHMAPADHVGGDYYDIINVSGMDWIVIGDVSGHGVPAGLIMMMVQTAIHTVLAGTGNPEPQELLSRVNHVITENVHKLHEDKYMTITVIACLSGGRFYHSGLHQDIMIYRAAEHRVELIETNGIWIGLMDDITGMTSQSGFAMTSGDVMFLYTDGITEAWEKGSIKDERDPEISMYGAKKLNDIFLELGGRPPEDIKRGILTSLEHYECTDDITMVIIKKL